TSPSGGTFVTNVGRTGAAASAESDGRGAFFSPMPGKRRPWRFLRQPSGFAGRCRRGPGLRKGGKSIPKRPASRRNRAAPRRCAICRFPPRRFVVRISAPPRRRLSIPPARSTMPVQPYLFFEGRADEAIAFYGKTLDAQVLMRMTYGDSPEGDGTCPDGSTPPADKVMHAGLRIDGTEVDLSDGMCSGRSEERRVGKEWQRRGETQGCE